MSGLKPPKLLLKAKSRPTMTVNNNYAMHYLTMNIMNKKQPHIHALMSVYKSPSISK